MSKLFLTMQSRLFFNLQGELRWLGRGGAGGLVVQLCKYILSSSLYFSGTLQEIIISIWPLIILSHIKIYMALLESILNVNVMRICVHPMILIVLFSNINGMNVLPHCFSLQCCLWSYMQMQQVHCVWWLCCVNCAIGIECCSIHVLWQ